MQHGLWLTNGDDILELVERAVAAEDAGWDGVFVSDSLPHSVYPDPWVLLASIAARTEEIRLGTWVVPVPRRQPWQVAQEVATLDRLSDGRVILGAGLGNDDEYEAFGRPYEPRTLGDRFDEALDVIDGLWTGDPFSYDGDHFTLADAEVGPTPVQQPRVPILLGCWWPNKKPLHRGARWDGIMPFWPSLTGDGRGPNGEEATGSPEEVRAILEYYHGITDDPGEILLPNVPSKDAPEYVDICRELGATWLLTTDIDASSDDADRRIREGPPS
jgi:alkanesulfonate monooxygenase SsuD/methylene tetrahydromethanopterin reductase-like flavin-dependent oxidoreductase (luciferase family)